MALVQEDRHVTLKGEKNAQPQVAQVDTENGVHTGVWLPGNGVKQSPGSFDIGAVIPKPNTGANSASGTQTRVTSSELDATDGQTISTNHRTE